MGRLEEDVEQAAEEVVVSPLGILFKFNPDWGILSPVEVGVAEAGGRGGSDEQTSER